jgi:AraC-like DNA-binding protein
MTAQRLSRNDSPDLSRCPFSPGSQGVTVTHGWLGYSTPLGDFYASPGDIIVIPAHLPHASHGSSASIVTHLYVPSDHSSAHGIVVPQIIRKPASAITERYSRRYRIMRKDGRRDNQSTSTGVLPEQVLDQKLDVSAIAAQLGYSTDGFIRAFKWQFGMTPAAVSQID